MTRRPATCARAASRPRRCSVPIGPLAARLYPDDPQPVLGVALAGRAASVMRNSAVFWHDGRPVTMDGSTIHRALKMARADDDYSLFGHIDRPILASDESSMNNSRLMAALLGNTTAKHVLFSGDKDQLQPIGAGAPYRDMIESGVIPTVSLAQNYRTNCQGILALCNDILAGTVSSAKLPTYLGLGGVFYVPCDHGARPQMIAAHYADLIEAGLFPIDIRVLSPHNQGEDGTRLINVAIRNELGLPPDKLTAGDILLVTENDYHATTCPGFPRVSGDEEDGETIFNGELCEVYKVGADFIDVKFDGSTDGIRHVRLILNEGDDANKCLPDKVTFGRCMSVHKGQGSQFQAVIMPTERGNDRFGIIQRSLVYTAASRGIDRLVIIGNFDDFVHAATTRDLPRYTMLRDLLIEGARS